MSTRNLLLIIIGLAILGGGWLLLSSQGTQPGPASPTVTTQPTGEPTPATSSATTSEMTIAITSAGFSPQQVTIKAGETVTWVNNNTVDHQVNSAPHPAHTDYPPLNTIGLLKAGERKSLAFPDAGTYRFHDHLNPTLFGSVTVQ